MSKTPAVLTNAQVVTADGVFRGTIVLEAGRIAAVDEGLSSLPGAVDCEGDYLIPGLVELHTDHLESHVSPRPAVILPPLGAVLAHDAQIAASAITTVFDAISLGVAETRQEFLEISVAAVRETKERGLLRADHFLHLRCEVVHDDTVDFFLPYRDEPLLRMVSLMDHTPGQRQWADLEKYKTYYGWRLNLSNAELDKMIQDRLDQQHERAEHNRKTLLDLVVGKPIALASHDDTEPSHVEEAADSGLTISEFPTTRRAADAARRRGMGIIMGAPNLVLGGSHSGNVSALELAHNGLLDALASDYVPASLLQGALELHREADFTLPQAIATVTSNPAEMAGLDDRGSLQPGLRADVARVRDVGGLAQVISVWREGIRVC